MKTEAKIIVGLTILQLPLVLNLLNVGILISPGIFCLMVTIWLIIDRRCWWNLQVLDDFIIVYLLCSLATIGFYAIPSNPASVYSFIIGINVAVVPVLMYFVGRSIKSGNVHQLLRNIILLHALIVVFSILLHILRPEFYTTYLFNAFQEVGVSQEWQLYARLQGYLGSTSLGILCSISLILTIATNFKYALKLVFILIFFTGALLSFQRSSILIAIVFMMFFCGYGSARYLLRNLALLSSLVAIGIIYLSDNFELLRVLDRVTEVSDAINFSDRESYGLIFNQMAKYPFGLGLGATTSDADRYGYNPGGQLVDANHLRILADLGPIGLLIFLCIAIGGLKTACAKKLLIPFGLTIIVYNLQALGTNVFDSFYTGHLYWLYIGIIAGAKHEKYFIIRSYASNHLNEGIKKIVGRRNHREANNA